MKRRDIGHLLVIIIGALAVRAVLFKAVAINGDTGLYLYDAKQLLWGMQPMVEFPTRSPLMEALLAGAIWLGDSPIIAARTLMLAVNLGLIAAVYGLARQLRGHWAGLGAAALIAFTPFPAVWGLWVKTESVSALVLITAALFVVRGVDRDELGWQLPVVVGVLIGTAFLIRRVAVIHLGAFGLFVMWYRWRQGASLAETARVGTTVAVTAVGTLLAAYITLTGFNLQLAAAVAETHALALVLSDGQGSLGWVGLNSAKAVTAASEGVWWQTICQKCGLNTIVVFKRTFLVVLPLVTIGLAFLRSWVSETNRFLGETVLMGVFVGAGVYSLWNSTTALYVEGIALASVLLASALLVWTSKRIPWQDLWDSRLALPLLVVIGLTAGYLYRDRILYVTYFQDFYPWLAVLGGVTMFEWARAQPVTKIKSGIPPVQATQTWIQYRSIVAGIALLVFVLSSATAGAYAYPYQPEGVSEDSEWHSIESVQETGADLEARTQPNQRVFTAQPLYAIEADRKIAANLSRKFYVFHGWPESEQADATAGVLERQLRSGQVPVAVIDSEAQWVLERDGVRDALQSNYCAVDDGGTYAQTNGTLYRYAPNETDNCETYVHHSPDR